MQIEGIQTRAHDVPGVRKKMPAPFMRDQINLDGGRSVKRAWRDVKILDIAAGDIVADFGRVSATAEIMKVPGSAQLLDGSESLVWKVRLHNAMNEYQDFPAEQRVYAFVREHGDE